MNVDDVSTACTLCTCTTWCSRSCTVCQSPRWKGQRVCVRRLHGTLTAPDALTNDQIADRAIELIEQLGVALEPWQAWVLRQLVTCEHVMIAGVRQPVPRGHTGPDYVAGG